MQSTNSFQYAASLITFAEISCPLPNITNANGIRMGYSKLHISLTNDEEIYNTPAEYIIYDSTCVFCNSSTRVCDQKVYCMRYGLLKYDFNNIIYNMNYV